MSGCVLDAGDGEAFFDDLTRRAVEARVPLDASIELTHRCNLRCVHCYLGDQDAIRRHRPRELDTGEVIALLDELAEARTLNLTFTGGSVGGRTGSISIVGATFRTRVATDSGPDGFTGLAAYELELIELQLFLRRQRMNHRYRTARVEAGTGLIEEALHPALVSQARVAELVHAYANNRLHGFEDAPSITGRRHQLRNAFGHAEPLAQLLDVENARKVALVVLDDHRNSIRVDSVLPQIVVEVADGVVVSLDRVGLAVDDQHDTVDVSKHHLARRVLGDLPGDGDEMETHGVPAEPAEMER